VEKVDSLILGYGFFRIASDIEKLPFPLAPMGAAGILALSENNMGTEGWRWRCFSLSSAIGMVFGVIYIGIPTLSSTFLSEPFQILPIPWLDTTTDTQAILPATATGISFDLAHFFAGMAFPFFAVLGNFIGLVVTLVANPYLHEWGVLNTWKPGMSTVETMFANNVDFYLSFGIGLSLAVAIIGLYQVFATLREKAKPGLDSVESAIKVSIPKGRGDIPVWLIIAVYLTSSAFYILLSGYLLDWEFQGWRMPAIMVFFALANAGLPGTSGFVGEFLVILSSFKANFWYAFLAATTLILGAAYTLWLVKRVVFGAVANKSVASLSDINMREFFVLGMLAIFVLGLGLWPAPLVDVMSASVENLVEHIMRQKF